MKVFEFGVTGYHSREWIVAEDFVSAARCAQKECDLVDLEDGGTLTVRMLTDEEVQQKKFDPDPLGTGEFNEARSIPFSEAIKLRTDKAPYLLCSYID